MRMRRNNTGHMDKIVLIHRMKRGYKVGFVMWMLMFVSMFAFDTGVMPIVAVGVMLIVMYVAYCREFVRLQK